MTPYLVAAGVAATLAVIEQWTRLRRFPLAGGAYRWWLARIALEVAVASVFVATADLLSIKVDKYTVTDTWWGGGVLAVSAAMVARSSLVDVNAANEPGASSPAGGDAPPAGALPGFPQGVIGFAAYFNRARAAIEKRLDQTAAAGLSQKVSGSILPALLNSGESSAGLAYRIRIWVQAQQTMTSTDQARELKGIDNIANDDGVDEADKIAGLLGLIVEMRGTDLLNSIQDDLKGPPAGSGELEESGPDAPTPAADA